MRTLILLPFIIFLLLTDPVFPHGKLHTPFEILKIMEQSKLMYEIRADFVDSGKTEKPTVLSNQLYLSNDSSGSTSVYEYKLTPEANGFLAKADSFYQVRAMEKAREYYDKMMAAAPGYNYGYTLLGDNFYIMGLYDSAIVYFKKAIEKNFIDYNAHWFLADAYHKMEEFDSALYEITLAHLLNINHEGMKKALVHYRKDAGEEWKEWDFSPKYSLTKEGNRVIVNAKEEWLGYAMVKAVWKYEPGYAESMIGSRKDSILLNTTEEKEALLACLQVEKFEDLNDIVSDGYVNEFLLYEVIGKKYPLSIVMQPRETLFKLAEYLNEYH